MLRFILTWTGLFGVYLLLSGDTGSSELIAGSVVATAVGLLVLRLQTIARRNFAWPRGGLNVIAGSLASVVPDTARVAGVLSRAALRRPAGEVGTAQEQAFPLRGNAERDAARHAFETLGQSLSPNGFAVAVQTGALRLHRLAKQ